MASVYFLKKMILKINLLLLMKIIYVKFVELLTILFSPYETTHIASNHKLFNYEINNNEKNNMNINSINRNIVIKTDLLFDKKKDKNDKNHKNNQNENFHKKDKKDKRDKIDKLYLDKKKAHEIFNNLNY